MSLVLGSAILPPSRIPEWNPRTQYVVHIYLSFASDRFPPRIRTSLLHAIYITVYRILTSIHSLISHPSHSPPIFPSVHLCYPDFLWTLMFHPYLLCSTRVVFKISSLYFVSLESTLLYSAFICPSCSTSKSPHSCVSISVSVPLATLVQTSLGLYRSPTGPGR